MKQFHNKTILVVDDDLDTLSALQKVLTARGANVICAEWAGDAIEILTKRDPSIDLVLTDLRMPAISGVTMVYAIHQVFPDLPMIVLTGFSSPEVKEECLKQGATAILEKPLRTVRLIQMIQDVFDGPQATQARAEHRR